MISPGAPGTPLPLRSVSGRGHVLVPGPGVAAVSGRRGLLSVSVGVTIADVVPVLPGHGGPVLPVLAAPRPVARHGVASEDSDHVSKLNPGSITIAIRTLMRPQDVKIVKSPPRLVSL